MLIRPKTKLATLFATFLLAVAPAMASAATWTTPSSGPISLPAGPGLGSPYPSTIAVANLPGTLTKLAVAVNYQHSFDGSELDAALVGPGGQNVMLISDACGNFGGFPARDFTFDDAAAGLLSDDGFQCPAGTYKPTNYAILGIDDLPAPGPGEGPFGTALSVFNGASPNGTWSLFAVDDEAAASGSITGWRLTIQTDAPDTCAGRRATLLGTDAPERLKGTSATDVIVGFGGRDVIQGLAGNDVICGGGAGDELIGGKGRDRLLGEAGKDRLKGGPGNDKLVGGPGKDKQVQ
jgi:hypothetical protein